MAGETLNKILKDKTQQPLFMRFLKEKGLTPIFNFLKKPVTYDKAYHEYFSENPKVDLKLTARILGPARKIYTMKLDAMKQQKSMLSDAYQEAVDAGDSAEIKRIANELIVLGDLTVSASSGANFKVILKAAIDDRLKFMDEKAGKEFKDYVSGKVDGKQLAKSLKLPPETADELANARTSLIFGDKAGAKKAADNAVKKLEKSKLQYPDWAFKAVKMKKGGETLLQELQRSSSKL